MKQKPAVKNELFLENVLTLHNEDDGAILRVAVQEMDMVVMSVHKPRDREYKDVYLLFTSEQMEQLVTLWNEWKDDENQDHRFIRRIIGMQKELDEVDQTLGRSLGYPRYCDDQKNFPDTTDADGVCTGDHTAVSLAMEAAARIELLESHHSDY